MTGYLHEVAVAAAAIALLLSGAAKIVRPGPITGTLFELRARIAKPSRSPGSAAAGWLLGAGEMLLAVLVITVRSWVSSAALGLFGLALAAAGVVGMRGGELPCNCFGARDKPLGRAQIVQFPLWAAAAWSAARPATGISESPDGRAAALAACLALAAAVSVIRMWRAVGPMARARRGQGEAPAW